MLHDIIFLILGITLVLAGANYLTDGATAVAKKFHVSELVIGLTIVAIGSSTPDLVVSLTSTLEGKGALAVGNILGANIFDIFLVVGLCALVRPVEIGAGTLKQEFPMVVLSSAVFGLMACDVLIDGMPMNFIDRSDGIILLFFFLIYCYITYLMAKSQGVPSGPSPSSTSGGQETKAPEKPMKMWLAAIMIGGGLAGLVIGGNWFVSSASGIAGKSGMSESLIGLTIVAIGSSLPDLSTSFIAALKGHSGLAVGNVVGSCTINAFFTVGVCATVRNLKLGTINAIDFGVLLLGSIMLVVFGRFWGKRVINRYEGAILTTGYVAYIVYLIVSNK